MKFKATPYAIFAALAWLASACSSSDSPGEPGKGGTPGNGGSPGSGGAAPSSGGAQPSSGGAATSSGGKSDGSGGQAISSGGALASGGVPAGGRFGTGGRSGTGGSAGSGTSGSGSGTGGAGTAGSGGDVQKSAGCGKTPTLKAGNDQTFAVSGGSSRKFNLKVPEPYDNTKPYRLIVGYHWLNGTAKDVSDGGGTAKSFYGLWDQAAGSTIFVAPQGINNGWSNTNGADVEFSKQLITKLEDEFCIDKSRIFCEGFSMGGSMSYAMASALPEMIRAVAVHSGGAMSGTTPGHNKPVAYFMTHGTKDSVCKYPGYGVPQLQDFAKVNGCTKPDPSASADAFEKALPEPTSTASACVQFEGCKEGYPTRACLFVGDHTPSPDGTNGWVPKETWKFFTQF